MTTPPPPKSSRSTPTRKAFVDAVAYASELHAQQTRKGTETPYLAHLLAVASLVLENGGDEEQAIAGLLHDGPEDQGGVEVLDEIRRRFGDRVADMVAECSDTFETPKPPWRDRKESYIRHLREASTGTFLVSAADKVHNLGCILRDYRNIGEILWDRFKASRAETIWYYTTLTETYERRGPQEVQPLARELRLLLQELNALVTSRDRGSARSE
jgi:(p)ppGpp synthase/HD superfamily hydrolase